MTFYICVLLGAFCHRHRKAFVVNSFIIVFLIVYTLAGGFIFLHFEHTFAEHEKVQDILSKANCVDRILRRNHSFRQHGEQSLSRRVAEECLSEHESDPRLKWSYKTAALYGFGILTTLGYGKIEPRTHNGRLFTVIYGFLGIPLTVILLTNIGRYMETMALKLSRLCRRKRKESETITGTLLFIIVILYLSIGAVFIPLLHGGLDFFNGIYFAFICLTAIEYGDLVPDNDWLVPVVIVYVSLGLAISTIALDIGSMYVRKLHYIGRKLKNIAKIRIWFGAKDLEVHELITAVGQNIGIEQHVMADIDIDNLVQAAIMVKEGRLPRVPQTHMVVEGIWPPELVPLFMKDGEFPVYADSDEDLIDFKPPKRTVVRFEDEVTSDIDDTLTSEAMPSRLTSQASRSDSLTHLPILNQIQRRCSVPTTPSTESRCID